MVVFALDWLLAISSSLSLTLPRKITHSPNQIHDHSKIANNQSNANTTIHQRIHPINPITKQTVNQIIPFTTNASTIYPFSQQTPATTPTNKIQPNTTSMIQYPQPFAIYEQKQSSSSAIVINKMKHNCKQIMSILSKSIPTTTIALACIIFVSVFLTFHFDTNTMQNNIDDRKLSMKTLISGSVGSKQISEPHVEFPKPIQPRINHFATPPPKREHYSKWEIHHNPNARIPVWYECHRQNDSMQTWQSKIVATKSTPHDEYHFEEYVRQFEHQNWFRPASPQTFNLDSDSKE
jgi:hypothetical protein